MRAMVACYGQSIRPIVGRLRIVKLACLQVFLKTLRQGKKQIKLLTNIAFFITLLERKVLVKEWGVM
jgi:membrane-bound acyltransferase YfiQ involved in biofilm formation